MTTLDNGSAWRRNPDKGNWSRVRLSLSRFLNDNWERGHISQRALADDLGVSDRTVRRWLTGEKRPAVEYQEAIEQWLIERRQTK